jgi:two-component system sensor histidine kinase KdpD
VLGAAVYDYLFTPPLYSFDISDPQNVIALGLFLITALVVGKLAGTGAASGAGIGATV